MRYALGNYYPDTQLKTIIVKEIIYEKRKRKNIFSKPKLL